MAPQHTVNSSVAEQEPVKMHRLRSPGLLRDRWVLWWQNCDNYYDISQIITIFTSVAKPEPVERKLFGTWSQS